MATWSMDEYAVSSKLAMFIYEESTNSDLLYGVREYGIYRVLPLNEDRITQPL